jgi:hypothetical protein
MMGIQLREHWHYLAVTFTGRQRSMGDIREAERHLSVATVAEA